jgi:putative nucleotidyltransferase with HDIG domain
MRKTTHLKQPFLEAQDVHSVFCTLTFMSLLFTGSYQQGLMHILIIDDTQLNITLLRHLIKKVPEYESTAFTDAYAALNWCRDNEPDLVVVDYAMAGMNGIEFTQQFRGFANYEDIPVLMITANSDSSVRHKALVGGVTDFLNKPLDNSEFVARARNMLALRQSRKKLLDHTASLAEEVRKATSRIVEQDRETIFCLAKTAEFRDAGTAGHIMRMAHYSKHIARVLGLSLEQQDLLLEAAPMHDIGKVGTPDNILLKSSKLNPSELGIMQQHALIGFEILNSSNSPLLKIAAEIAYTHHEKFDGSGYPRGLTCTDIPLFGRIVAVADVFDALTTARPYKKAWSVDTASKLLHEQAGRHFDPACIDAFFTDFDQVLMIKSQFMEDKN